MQVTSQLSREEHDHKGEDCASCGHDHEHAPVRLVQTVIGVIFVLNAFVVDWLFEQGHTVASGSAMIGAIILGYPIVWTSVKDIWLGILSINELVGIAVLAAFASGDYKTAGVVAFFMLMGEIIETRTAEGARHLRDTDQMYKLLVWLGWRPEIDVKYVRAAGAVHDEDAWAMRFGGVLRFLFPA